MVFITGIFAVVIVLPIQKFIQVNISDINWRLIWAPQKKYKFLAVL